jgi:membrane protein
VPDHDPMVDDATWPGHDAAGPHRIPLAGWRQIAVRVWRAVGEDHVTLMAAGLAFYGMLAVVPALIAAITTYGLVADPQEVEDLVGAATRQVSGGAAQIIQDQLTQIVSTSSRTLSLGLVASLAAALWSASAGIGNLMRAVNLAYDEVETRNYLRRRAIALAFTVGGILFVLIAVALIAILPALLGRLGLPDTSEDLVNRLRWPVLLLSGMSALALIYSIGPDRRAPRLRWVTLGSAVALAIWLAGSWGFSAYVENFASYNETYGSLGGVVVLLMWFYLTALAILLGAEINAEIELQTGVDTTVGPPRPRGQRGAVVADHTPLDDPRHLSARRRRELSRT